MPTLSKVVRRYAARFVAVGLILVFYHFTRLPEISKAERTRLAGNFSFAQFPLPVINGAVKKHVRRVQPDLKQVSAWISSVGASVALNDLDGDGLPNDVCYVDPRTDQVLIAPVPGTPSRYEPFLLDQVPPHLSEGSATTAPMGVLPGDLNEDGLMDVLVYYWGRTPIAFLQRQSASANQTPLNASRYTAQEIVPGGERWYTNAATLADVDGDGHADIIIGNYFQDGARILDVASNERAQMQQSMSRALNGGRNRLLLWNKSTPHPQPSVEFKEAVGVFEDEVASGWTLAVGATDLDGDLLPEIYFANDFGSDRLLHNRSQPGAPRFALLAGRKTLTTPRSKVLGSDSFKGMGVDFADLNGDGVPDIFVSNITDKYALEESNFLFMSTGETKAMLDGSAPFVDRSEPYGLSRSGWAWDVKFGDFDNDSTLEVLQAAGFIQGEVDRWPELHELAMGNDQLLSRPGNWPRLQPGDGLSFDNHNSFFVLAASGRFYDVAPELGFDNAQVSRGIATADVDGDGRLDFAVANQWNDSYFYLNRSARRCEFLELHLRLPVHPEDSAELKVYPRLPAGNLSRRPAIGASAVVHLPDGRKLTAQVDGGNGHSGKRSPDIHFGLGCLAVEAKLRVDLRWRDATGAAQQKTIHLLPGWWTVLLGA